MAAQTTPQTNAPKPMRTFFIIWGGQLLSMIGSGLSTFALGVWIYDQTGEATPFALSVLFGSLPYVLLAPLAGAVADRWNRRLIMIVTDTGSALLTILIAVMLFLAPGGLQVWHIYLVSVVGSVFGTFQEAAYQPSVTMLVPKEQFGRASGLIQTGQAVRGIIAPLLAGVLYVSIGLEGILIIDFASYFFAIGALLLVRIPQPEPAAGEEAEDRSIWQDMAFGWKYLVARTPLLVMLLYYALVNFLLAFTTVLLTPLVLSFSPASVLGAVHAAGSGGMLAGSLLMSAWGGPPRKMNGVFAFIALFSLGFFLIGLAESAVLVGLGMFVLLFSLPLASGCSQVIWMSKVEPEVQGRVFSVRRMLSSAISPIAYLVAGPLADQGLWPPDGRGWDLGRYARAGDWSRGGAGHGLALCPGGGVDAGRHRGGLCLPEAALRRG